MEDEEDGTASMDVDDESLVDGCVAMVDAFVIDAVNVGVGFSSGCPFE